MYINIEENFVLRLFSGVEVAGILTDMGFLILSFTLDCVCLYDSGGFSQGAGHDVT